MSNATGQVGSWFEVKYPLNIDGDSTLQEARPKPRGVQRNLGERDQIHARPIPVRPFLLMLSLIHTHKVDTPSSCPFPGRCVRFNRGGARPAESTEQCPPAMRDEDT